MLWSIPCPAVFHGCHGSDLVSDGQQHLREGRREREHRKIYDSSGGPFSDVCSIQTTFISWEGVSYVVMNGTYKTHNNITQTCRVQYKGLAAFCNPCVCAHINFRFKEFDGFEWERSK